jgi:hypothetical protein
MSCIRTTITATAAVGLLALVATVHGEEQHRSHSSASSTSLPQEPEVELTIDGEIIDITCYIRHDSRGPKHLKCALFCAEMGMPLGLLEDGTDEIYLILPSGHADPRKAVLPFVSKKVRVTGIPLNSGGLATIEIQAIEELGKKDQ